MKTFLQIFIINILSIFFLMNCEKKKKCWDINLCVDDVRTAVRKTGNILPDDGIIYLKERIYFLQYFEKQSRSIVDRYVQLNCTCDVIYFEDSLPKINNKIEFPGFNKN